MLKLPNLSKLKFTSGIIGGLILIVTISMIAVSIRYDSVIEIPAVEVPEPPVPVIIPVIEVPEVPEVPETDHNIIVEVSVESLSGMYQGGGLRVGNVVVSSVMIFIGRSQIVTVDGVEAEIIKRDDRLGLIALSSEFNSMSINDEPCLPPGESATIFGTRKYDVEVFRYVKDQDWMILTGDIPANAAGYPVMQGSNVIGLVIGLNSANVKQGIAASKQGLVKFLGELE